MIELQMSLQCLEMTFKFNNRQSPATVVVDPLIPQNWSTKYPFLYLTTHPNLNLYYALFLSFKK